MAQRRVGRARGERLVHVDEVERHRREQFLDRPGHVDRQRRWPSARCADDVQHLAYGDHARAAGVASLQQALGMTARRAQLPARVAHALLRARGGEHEHAMPAPRELLGDASHVAVDLVLLALPRIRGHVGDGERRGHRLDYRACRAPGRPRAYFATAGLAARAFAEVFAGLLALAAAWARRPPTPVPGRAGAPEYLAMNFSVSRCAWSSGRW